MTRRYRAALLCLSLLAGCASFGGWTKRGADATATARAHRDCEAAARAAVTTDTEIDQDILATRRGDWQRAGRAPLEQEIMERAAQDRIGAIVAQCMAGQGFVRRP